MVLRVSGLGFVGFESFRVKGFEGVLGFRVGFQAFVFLNFPSSLNGPVYFVFQKGCARFLGFRPRCSLRSYSMRLLTSNNSTKHHLCHKGFIGIQGLEVRVKPNIQCRRASVMLEARLNSDQASQNRV